MGCRSEQATRPRAPVFPPVSPVLRPVFSRGLFPRYFNDLSCIWRASTSCKSPVFFYNELFQERAARACETRDSFSHADRAARPAHYWCRSRTSPTSGRGEGAHTPCPPC